MKIYTSYFAKLKSLPQDIIPISICGKSPDWFNGLEYKHLAPKYGFFSEWKKNHDNDFYVKHYYDEVLSLLVPEIVHYKLGVLSNNRDVALICYEKPSDFCHRHLVAKWLTENGYEVSEYDFGNQERLI